MRRGEPHARQERDHVLGESAAFEKAEKNQRAEERPAVVAAAAEDEGEPDEQAFLRQEHVRLDVREIVREEDAGEPRDARAEREGLDLEPEHGLARDGGDDLVLADRPEHAAERRATQALERRVDERDHDQHEGEVKEVVVSGEARVERARNRGHAVRAAREPRFVQEEQPQDLAEAEGDDGEVILSESQRDHRQAGAGRGGEPHRRRPREDERRAPDGQQGGRVRADGEERDGTEVHEPGQAPLDVQAERQERPDADERRDGGEVGDHARALTSARRRGRSASPAAPRE